MPSFSNISLDRLRSVHPDLQVIFLFVIKYFDCSVISGIRTLEEQQELYAKGRTKPGGIVTYKDGIVSKSKHQEGLAVDVVPYPEMYEDRDKLKYFAGFVLGVATILKEQGLIDSEIVNGIDWDGDKNLRDQSWVDLPHYEIKK